MRRRLALASAFALCCGPGALALGPADGRDTRPDLAGQWRLNRDESDDARVKVREAMARRRSNRLGARGIVGGGPFGSAPVGRAPLGAGPRGGSGVIDSDAASLRELLNAPETLAITQTPEELSFEDGEGNVLRLRPDGRRVKREGGEVQVKARWNGQELVVESERRDGPKMITSYVADADRRHLPVISRLEGRMEDVTVRRVYDAVHAP